MRTWELWPVKCPFYLLLWVVYALAQRTGSRQENVLCHAKETGQNKREKCGGGWALQAPWCSRLENICLERQSPPTIPESPWEPWGQLKKWEMVMIHSAGLCPPAQGSTVSGPFAMRISGTALTSPAQTPADTNDLPAVGSAACCGYFNLKGDMYPFVSASTSSPCM